MDYNVRDHNVLFARGNLFVGLFKTLFASEHFREHTKDAIIFVRTRHLDEFARIWNLR